MITADDWKTVRDEICAEERERLGEPPTYEEVVLYLAGRLPPAETERVRDLVACHPEIARFIATGFPDDDAIADGAVIDDESLEMCWLAFERRLYASCAPPSEEDLVRLLNGTLPPTEAAGVRDSIEDPRILSDEEVAADIEKIRARIQSLEQ